MHSKIGKDSLGDRMKKYENVERRQLTRRMPTIIRIDGKAFHSFTKGFKRPFDDLLMKSMWATSQELAESIQGCKIAYTQSDEISLLLTDYETISTEAWFDKNLQKIVSVSSSMATMAFNRAFYKLYQELPNKPTEPYSSRLHTAMFDSRVFLIPREEVCNYFLWRQRDATRNAILSVGQANFSHDEMQEKNTSQLQEMLWQERNINFNDLPITQRRGACIIKETYDKNDVQRSRWRVDEAIPIFSADRNYIEKYI